LKLKDALGPPKEIGSIPQRRAERRFTKYIVAAFFSLVGFVLIGLGATLTRTAEVALVEKYRSLIVTDSLEDPVPKVDPGRAGVFELTLGSTLWPVCS
jgi:hypothetical protein